MSELEIRVLSMYAAQHYIWEIAEELDMTEFEVTYILRKHHYM